MRAGTGALLRAQDDQHRGQRPRLAEAGSAPPRVRRTPAPPAPRSRLRPPDGERAVVWGRKPLSLRDCFGSPGKLHRW